MFITYNLPLLFWATWALLASFAQITFSICVFHNIGIDCWGCGLTQDLLATFKGQRPSSNFVYLILVGFTINFLISLKYLKPATSHS